MTTEIGQLAGFLSAEGWNAIKGVPRLHRLVLEKIGSSSTKTGPNVSTLLESLPLNEESDREAALTLLCALSLSDDENAVAAKSKLIVIAAEGNYTETFRQLLYQMLSSNIVKSKPDGTEFQLKARLFILFQDLLILELETIIRGLNHPDASARKQAMYICRLLVEQEIIGDKNVLLCPTEEAKMTWRQRWDRFFFLYDTFQEPQAHLIQPLLPVLMEFLVEDRPNQMGISWWKCLVQQAFDNSAAGVRKMMLEYIINDVPLERYSALALDEEFVFGPFLTLVDNSYLYSGIDFHRLVSLFGLSAANFFVRFINAVEGEARKQRLVKYVHHLERLTSNLALIFLLKALVDMNWDRGAVFDRKCLEVLVSLSDHQGFHNAKARLTLRELLTETLVKYTNPDEFDERELARIIFMLTRELPLGINNTLQSKLSSWLLRCSSNFLAISRLIESFHASHLAMDASSIERTVGTAESVCLYAALIHSQDTSTSTLSKIVFSGLDLALQTDNIILFVRAAILLLSFDDVTKRVSNGALGCFTNLNIDDKLYALLSKVHKLCVLDPMVAGQHHDEESEALDISALNVLLRLERLLVAELFKQSTHADSSTDKFTQRMLVEHMDIMMIDGLNALKASTTEEGSQGYDQQLVKIAALATIAMVLNYQRQLKVAASCPLSQEHIYEITHISLFKAPGLTEQQCSSWPRLFEALVEYKWKVVAEYAQHLPLDSPGELQQIFELAIIALPESQYFSSVAIVSCIQSILELLSKQSDLGLIMASCVKAWKFFREFLTTNAEEKSKWFSIYANCIIDCLFQESIASIEALHVSLLKEAFMFFLEEVESKHRGILPRLTLAIYPFLKHNAIIRMHYFDIFPELLMYGPIRNIPEERLADAFISH